MSKPLFITVTVTEDEREYVVHAASLKRLPLDEYVKRAINAQLQRDGVDAVLIHQSDWE